MATKNPKGKQGFASMDPEKQREIARRGGQRAQSLGKAHRFTQEEARQAGAKGGRALSRNRAHMAEIGRRGRAITQRRRAEAKNPHAEEQ